MDEASEAGGGEGKLHREAKELRLLIQHANLSKENNRQRVICSDVPELLHMSLI